QAIREARRLRGHRTGWQSAPGVLVPLLLSTLEQALQYGESLDARGYGSRHRSRYRPLQWSALDAAAIIASLAALTVTLVFPATPYNPYVDLAPTAPTSVSLTAVVLLAARIGFVFQHPDAQFVLEDVEAELAFGLENLGLGRSLMRKRIEEVIDQVGIHALRRRRIGTLSGGERQRVAIAAALAMHPQALALDEPTSQLDPQAAEDVLQVVLRLVAELGMTTVIAEHRVERIAPFVDRIWTLESGSMQDQAPRAAVADGGARPPVVDLAIRAGW